MLRPDTIALTALLGLLSGLGPFSVDMYLASMLEIGRVLRANPAEVQLTLSSYLIGFAVFVGGPILFSILISFARYDAQRAFAGIVEGNRANLAESGLGAVIAVGAGLGALYWGLVVWRGRARSEPSIWLGGTP